jgi:hypothetical protein
MGSYESNYNTVFWLISKNKIFSGREKRWEGEKKTDIREDKYRIEVDFIYAWFSKKEKR